ncbi:MAG: hypothetical protein E7311_02840 [Clostridiales bacterium]|nr:hypothetical protein [Clostridiales bacterium]
MKKKILFGSLLLALGIGIGACANPLNEWVEAYKWADVTIKYNGTVQTMYDVNGNVVYPLNYNGTTYVPVRAVSNIFNIAVDWDDTTKTVLLGENSDWTYLNEANVSKYTNGDWFQNNLNLSYEGIKYNTGFKYEENNNTFYGNASGLAYNLINLDLKYKVLSFKLITESETTVPIKITVDDANTGETLFSQLSETNNCEEILIDVTGLDNIAIRAGYTSVLDEKPGKNSTYIVDVKAK